MLAMEDIPLDVFLVNCLLPSAPLSLDSFLHLFSREGHGQIFGEFCS